MDHHRVNSKIRLIIFFAAKDGEALYSQQKQDWELTVAQIMSSLSPNSDLKKVGKTTRPFRYAANLLQSCSTLCDSIEGSPPGSPILGILQARTLEWVVISFSNESK